MNVMLIFGLCLVAFSVEIEAGCFADENVIGAVQDLENMLARKYEAGDLMGYMKIFGKKYGYISLLKPLESDDASVLKHLKYLRTNYPRYRVKVEEAIQINCDAAYSIATKTWYDASGKEKVYTRSVSLMVKECEGWKVSRYLSANLALENSPMNKMAQ